MTHRRQPRKTTTSTALNAAQQAHCQDLLRLAAKHQQSNSPAEPSYTEDGGWTECDTFDIAKNQLTFQASSLEDKGNLPKNAAPILNQITPHGIPTKFPQNKEALSQDLETKRKNTDPPLSRGSESSPLRVTNYGDALT